MEMLGARLHRHRDDFAIAAISLAASFSVHVLSALRFPNDDQFITFRYIDHIAAGQGFVYNLGQHVLGTTTPLFTLLGAALKALLPMVPTPELMAWTNIVLIAAGALVFRRLLARFIPESYAFLGALVFVFDLAKAVPEGMESPLFILLALSFLHALLTDRYRVSAVWLALACLTRPDAGLIGLLAFAYWWYWSGAKEALKCSVITFAVALPWIMFAMWYFGSPIPQSLIAKMHGHDIYIIPGIQAFKVQLAALSRIYWGSVFDPDNLVVQTLCNLLPFVVLAALGAWRLIRKGFWILPAIPLLYFTAFSITDPVLFPWYSTQMEPLWIIMSWVGAVWLFGFIRQASLGRLLAVALLVGPLMFWALLVTSTNVGSKGGLFEMGQYLRVHAKSGETIALSNIGIVGYVTGAPIIDTIGLTFPSSAKFYPWMDSCRDMANLYQMPPALVMELQPDWLVTGSTELTSCFRASSWFTEHYEPASGWNSERGDIWHKRTVSD